MRKENTPPSHGVSSGPKTVAFHTNKFSSDCGLALHPCPLRRRVPKRRRSSQPRVRFARFFLSSLEASVSFSSVSQFDSSLSRTKAHFRRVQVHVHASRDHERKRPSHAWVLRPPTSPLARPRTSGGSCLMLLRSDMRRSAAGDAISAATRVRVRLTSSTRRGSEHVRRGRTSHHPPPSRSSWTDVDEIER